MFFWKSLAFSMIQWMFDLNRIPYDYTLEMTKRCKGLDLIESAEELWTEVHNTAQGTVTKTILKKRTFKKSK